MSKEKIYIFDTTLRDGAQTEGVDFSIEDKNKIAKVLSDIGVDYVEGGWPGANPVDTKFFSSPPKMQQTLFTAFGMTKKTGRSADNDPGLASLMNANTPAVCVVGKSWDFHVKVALGIQKEENLENIKETAKHFVKNKKEFLFDAEHFFDGYKANPEYAIDCLKQAYDNGARWVVLCDTNGGTLPNEVREIVAKVSKIIPGTNLGIHAHNDTENAVANSLAAVESGVRHIQGTINGIGERCGNTDLVSVISNLQLKMKVHCIPPDKVNRLFSTSKKVWELTHGEGPQNQPFVGENSFAHKGGIHVSALQISPEFYEHIRPESIGNKRHILISELSGQSNIINTFGDKYPELKDKGKVKSVLHAIQDVEKEGLSYEGASASLESLLEISVLPTPVGPIIRIFFGSTSSLISSVSACLLHLFLSATATAFFASFCPITYLSSSETISLGERALTFELLFLDPFTNLRFVSFFDLDIKFFPLLRCCL